MQTDLWAQFGDLAAGSVKYLATVTAHNADGTASITTAEGAQSRVFGRLESVAIPYNVWISGGRIIGQAPSAPITNVTV